MDRVGLLLLACEMAARGSSLRARFRFLRRGSHHRAARVAAASSSHRFARAGDEQEGAWPRERLKAMGARLVERLERAIKRGEERPPMHPAAEAGEQEWPATATRLRVP